LEKLPGDSLSKPDAGCQRSARLSAERNGAPEGDRSPERLALQAFVGKIICPCVPASRLSFQVSADVPGEPPGGDVRLEQMSAEAVCVADEKDSRTAGRLPGETEWLSIYFTTGLPQV